MALLRRRREASADDAAFEGAVRWACTRLGLTVTAYDGDTIDVHGRIDGKVGLHDVRATCRLEPRERWSHCALEALEGLARSLESRGDLGDLSVAGPLLRCRVQTEGAVLTDDVVLRPLADGLVEVLVVLIGGAVQSVPSAAVGGWGEPVDALFDRARRQVLADGVLTRTPLDLGSRVLALESTGPFTATHLHWLPTYLDVPPAGALLTLPTRHLLLAAPMTGREQVLDAAQALLVNAERLWREGPGGLCPDLWWWRAGAGLVLLPGTPTSLSPPLAFLDVLDALP